MSTLPPKADIDRRLFGLVTMLSMWRLAKTLAMIARRLCEKVEASQRHRSWPTEALGR